MPSPERIVRSAFAETPFWIAVGAASALLIGGLLWTRSTGPLDRAERLPQRPVPSLVIPQDVLIASDTLSWADALPITPSPEPSTVAARPSVTGDSTAGASTAPPDSGDTVVADAQPTAAATDPTERAEAAPTDSTRRRVTAARDSTDLTPQARSTLRRLAELAEATDGASSSRQAAATGTVDQEPEMSSFEAAVSGQIPEDAGDDDGPTITGLVTDETRTKVGRDFYDAFYDRWQSPDKDFYYTVVVSEQPMPSLGTRVVVRLNQNVVFQTRLQPRSEMVERAAHRAVVLTQRRLQSNPSTNVY